MIFPSLVLATCTFDWLIVVRLSIKTVLPSANVIMALVDCGACTSLVGGIFTTSVCFVGLWKKKKYDMVPIKMIEAAIANLLNKIPGIGNNLRTGVSTRLNFSFIFSQLPLAS